MLVIHCLARPLKGEAYFKIFIYADIGTLDNGFVNSAGQYMVPVLLFPRRRAGYVMAMVLIIAFSVASMLGCWFMKWVLWRDNKKLLAEHEGTGVTPNLYTL